MRRPQLVLDIAGVIATNFPPLLWQHLAVRANASIDELRTFFKKDAREMLWTGAVSEPEFWVWLQGHFPAFDPSFGRPLVSGHLSLLPASGQLAAWSQLADIHLLSNHRHEWVTPVITPLLPYIKSVTISSEVGCCKPDPRIYSIVQDHLTSSQSIIIYVDDQEKNFPPAKKLGWQTIVADREGMWTSAVAGELYNSRMLP
ncbi:hypothetical protein EBB07_21910 [Paenibacillaceae bacterium]|nr:hypothetical protein EBB07_21910 [Paenibacillaceae bacterium]